MARDGRPTKYTPELLEKAEYYIANWETFGRAVPSHMQLFLHLGINPDTGYTWAKEDDKADFSDILKQIKAMQYIETIDGSLKNDLNATIAKLLLGKHGLSDKIEQSVKQVSVEIDKSSTPEEAARAYQTLMGKE